MSVHLDPHETVVSPSEGWVSLDLLELWAHRDLVGFLVWRDIKVRYRQTFFGAAWAIVPPFFTMIVFTLIFGMLVKVPSDGHPYWAFSLCALIAWNYFSQSFTLVANSALNNSSLIEKVYFPRLSLPLAAALSPLLDWAIAFAFLLLILAVTGTVPSLRVLLVFPLTLIALATALGIGSFLAAINVRYRDVRHTVPLILQLWLFATPVVYPATLVPEPIRPFLGLNPMAGVVEGYRWALLDSSTFPWPLIGVASVCSIVVLIFGLLMFKRHERLFADLI